MEKILEGYDLKESAEMPELETGEFQDKVRNEFNVNRKNIEILHQAGNVMDVKITEPMFEDGECQGTAVTADIMNKFSAVISQADENAKTAHAVSIIAHENSVEAYEASDTAEKNSIEAKDVAEDAMARVEELAIQIVEKQGSTIVSGQEETFVARFNIDTKVDKTEYDAKMAIIDGLPVVSRISYDQTTDTFII
ncbi:MAG: hypothetical protein IJB98_03700 [Clostridia bacterium]|nr:hypothetical protein [Clostridia bacterium]